VIAERLDMLPLNRQVGFFSDAYCVEWVCGKAKLVRETLSAALAERVEPGQFDIDEATAVAAEILYDTTRYLLNIQPGKR